MHIERRAEMAFGQLPGRRSADPLAGADAGPLSIRLALLTAGPRAPHRHPLSVEAIFVVEGEGTHWQEGETARVRPGDVVLVPTGVAHATIPDAEMLLYCVFPVATLDGNVEELDEPIEL
ncbi:MAG TPA: cupin domain-containing protein [Gaiellaceae bacterium]|nr:cupin domain-containing protein [Gaiellaceae bacterium]